MTPHGAEYSGGRALAVLSARIGIVRSRPAPPDTDVAPAIEILGQLGAAQTGKRRRGVGTVRSRYGLAARAIVPLGSALPAPLLHQLHGPRNVSASAV